jgi:hypothetical protein
MKEAPAAAPGSLHRQCIVANKAIAEPDAFFFGDDATTVGVRPY